MIKKLRLKFIFTNMLLVTIALLMSFSILFIHSSNELKKSSINTMQSIAFSEHGRFDHLFQQNFGNDDIHTYISTYVIDINEEKNTCFIEGYGDVEDLNSEDSQYINELINEVFRYKNNEGVLSEKNMRFFWTDTQFGKRIVLLDKRYEIDYLKQLFISLMLAAGIAFSTFLIISIIISSIAIKPIEKSINQQHQLISDISHELKTPLTIISTNTDIVLSHKDESVKEQSQWLNYIKDETTRMSSLLNMMLYLAKSDESQEKFQLKKINFSNLTYEISLPFESVCFENNKLLTLDIDSDINIIGDETSLKQLIIILLDNAVKYSSHPGKIHIELTSDDEKAILSIFNTGVPIPKESIPRLFERFYRVEQSRTREEGGSGLGLSIAKRIIEQNEGSISVSSSKEHGTIFTCMFKISK